MAPSLIHEPIARLPIYQDGFRRGTDLGLRIALDALTAEQARQEQLATKRRAGSQVASRHTFARRHPARRDKDGGPPIPAVTCD
jgi:3-deoxy-D-arabino-heptulosonate 7-phosphate (DAHP) synthase